ncbi:MAG: hypothetical protein LIP04_15765, partial [Tannerellaceae bacterium]|nr:hypothetical protein [Tannerellaceae bacterium]
FDKLLNLLIQLTEKYPDFKIMLAEIITKDITFDFIKKMSLAGFVHIQIGYESASDTLLKKIEKKIALQVIYFSLNMLSYSRYM